MHSQFLHLPVESTSFKESIPYMGKRAKLLLHYRFLIYNLVMRDLKARYRNSVLGFLWSLLNPLGMMVVFTVVATVLFRDQTIENYPIFLLAGILPWNFFTASVMTGTNSVVSNGHLIKKIYFPTEVLPISAILANLVNFLLALTVLFAAIIVLRVPFSPWLWLLPVVILIHTLFALGVVFFLSTLQVYYHDTLIVMDVVLLAWFFLTPVFYSASMLPVSYTVWGITLDVRRLFYILNPMASLINMYRDLLYGGTRTDLDFFLRTAVTAVIVFLAGYWFFIRYSGNFSEEV
ncbi:MAG: ABC transporter permease [Caldilineaceae bacterium]|nr:ABC transporter permease [Caldilineaceae bacterium]